MGTAVSETPVESWAEQAAFFEGKAIPMVEQRDGTFLVRYPDGSLRPDDFPVPTVDDVTSTVVTGDGSTEDGFLGSGTGDGFPGPGFPASGEPAPGAPTTGKAATGNTSPKTRGITQ